MRALPRNISTHPDGFLVRVSRGSVLYQAFVSKSGPDCLARAIALRDRFLKVAEKPLKRRRTGHSNTGVPGISESVRWHRNKPCPVFEVFLGRTHRPIKKDILFGSSRPRMEAWRRAVALRRAVGAVISAGQARVPRETWLGEVFHA